jgi:basic membrane protein A
MVTSTAGIHDLSFNELTWEGMQAAAATSPKTIKVKYLASESSADYATNITAFIAERCGLIVTIGYLMGPATQSAANANPKQKFAIVDCSYASGCLTGTPLKNLDQILFNTVQDGFLGGYLAAGMSKTHVVATYGGDQLGVFTIYMDGFWDGAQYYDTQHHASVKVLGWDETTQKGSFIKSITNTAAAEKLTNTFIGDGADVIFPVAEAASLGTARAVQKAGAAGKSVAMEWADTDGCYTVAKYCTYFLSSVTKGMFNAAKAVVLAAVKGTFATTYIGTLANGGVALAPYHDYATKVPAALKAEITTIESEIESGKIVPATKSPV